MQDERQRLLQTIQDLESRTATLTSEKENLEHTLSQREGGNPSTTDEVESSSISASTHATMLDALRAEIDDLRRDLDVQLVENETMRGNLKAFTQKYDASREIQAKLEMENQQLADELDITRDKVHSIKPCHTFYVSLQGYNFCRRQS